MMDPTAAIHLSPFSTRHKGFGNAGERASFTLAFSERQNFSLLKIPLSEMTSHGGFFERATTLHTLLLLLDGGFWHWQIRLECFFSRGKGVKEEESSSLSELTLSCGRVIMENFSEARRNILVGESRRRVGSTSMGAWKWRTGRRKPEQKMENPPASQH